jgi:hypothetical protein
MFLPVVVLDWRIDGGRRVPDKTNGNLYILNTTRMFEITEAYDHHMQMFYFDNLVDSRCGGAHMKIDTTLAGLLNGADSDYGTVAVTVSAYPDNDPTATPANITLQKLSISYCKPYGNDQSNALTWIYYINAGWEIEKILVNHSWIPLYSILES